MRYPERVTVREVGPRDGIQSERATVATERKIELIDALSATGLERIEATSFVSARAVPQMADAPGVLAGIRRRAGVVFSALVPDRVRAERALAARADSLQVFVAATDAYNRANLRKNVGDSLADVADVAALGRSAGVPVEGTISTAFGCPYTGDVEPRRVVEVARAVTSAGIDAVSLGDTTGMATPRRVADVVGAFRDALPDARLNMHFHDTRGTGLANVLAALDLGVEYFDSSVGGMGGSPFAAGATGNVATEDLVHMLDDMGIATGVDLDALLEAAALAERVVGRELPGKVLRAGPRSRVAAASG